MLMKKNENKNMELGELRLPKNISKPKELWTILKVAKFQYRRLVHFETPILLYMM